MSRNPYRRADFQSRRAREQGFPARSVFKLEEIDRRVQLLRPGFHVLDLGAAPGSWSMYASKRIGGNGCILAIDRKPITVPLGANVSFVQADAFSTDAELLQKFAPYDVVLSDMAPSTTGYCHVDEIRSAELFMRAVDTAYDYAKEGGAFVGKIFMGSCFEQARAHLRARFEKIRIIRPDATRKCSVETFMIGLGRL